MATLSSKVSSPSVRGCFMMQKTGGPPTVLGLANIFIHVQSSFKIHFNSLSEILNQASNQAATMLCASLELLSWPPPYCWKDIPILSSGFHLFPALVQTVVLGRGRSEQVDMCLLPSVMQQQKRAKLQLGHALTASSQLSEFGCLG